MQFLGFPPRAAVAVFAEMFHDQSHVFQMAHARFWVPKPKTLRMPAHQGHRPLTQFRRGRRGRRQLAQFIRFGSHACKLRKVWSRGKPTLARRSSPAAPGRVWPSL